ncbi:DUF159 family protein (plasmid) [Pantoea ananatis]|uniref:SOS response-associated peptidase family protein n=2 Tax=Pantoea ananas TaxID=553 RepID=UPI000B60E150|nr:SOS response-associated peptidase family protein [Pantoea ananatis]ASN18168.1 DUF159 family protein [Pantoea ananatis]
MCGRFAQYSSRDEYFEAAGIMADELPFDSQALGRYNVAPGTRVMLLNRRQGKMKFDPVFWGYKPDWWHKAMLINARAETASTGKMFKPLWQNGRVVVPANGWFEWAKTNEGKQPYFIYRKSRQPVFFAAIGKTPFDKDYGHEGFVILTANSNQGMVDIHDRRPVVLPAEVLIEWLSEDTTPERAVEIVHEAALPEDDFKWHKVSKAVGDIHNQGAELIDTL